MRIAVLPLLAALAGAATLVPVEAQARVRVYVDLGDVLFSAGRPYHRHSHAPLYVVHTGYGPRYYHYGPVYAPPPRYYAPPPPRYYYHAPPPRVYAPRVRYAPPPRHWRDHDGHWRDDRRGHHGPGRHHDHDRDHGYDRGHGRGRGHHDR
ncbi:hypothetical protein [Coralloluteibacterium stylophorae]|uniref:DUF3300 domain-containing protein n=1 Tax=Coralloluteibacterium stylophorae TaxID=1776034 RepID=A0A8J8AX48_9GAMM|nr:hypothetical protein [Coralloluteibacterium stylophorae]MBS7458215.1 hypothetical protein [Coralloluteibacterium stylophorae]